jgi:hypothetical protein
MKSFYTKLAGVTKPNDDGSNRQRLLHRSKPAEELKLVRDPNNKYDKNAIKVFNIRGEQLGWISSDVADRLAVELDNGVSIKAEISEITGGTFAKETLGCNILITYL